MSLLLANGHPGAPDYPLGMVADEAALTAERINGWHATAGTVLHGAAAAVMTKEGGRHFSKLIKALNGE